MNFTRRNLLKSAMAMPAAAWLAHYQALAQPLQKKIKITAIKVLPQDNIPDAALIRVETDAGLIGYGEGMGSAQILRGQIAQSFLQSAWKGADPLAIEEVYYRMMSPENISRWVGLASGINIALWDIAGKALNQPVYRLMGGPLRPATPVYSNGQIKDMLDPAQCRDWVQKAKASGDGIRVYKFGPQLKSRSGEVGPWTATADDYAIAQVGKGFANIREAAGNDFDIAVHGGGSFDLPTAIGIAQAVEPMNPAWFEDPMDYVYSEAWATLKASTRTPILMGERINLLTEFKPFLDNGILKVAHVDPAFAGGFSGCRRIADYAAITRVPIACHSGPCGLTRFYASVHLGAVIQNYFRAESDLGAVRDYREKMARPGTELVIRDGACSLPTGPGLGLELNEDYLKSHTPKGEGWA